MSYITIPAALAPLVGPSVSGLIVTYVSWPWIFFLNLPIGLAGLLLVRAYIPEIREDEVAPLDLRGFVLIGLALAGLVFGFAALGRNVLPLPLIIASISIGAVCGWFYLTHARRKTDPIIDFKLLHIRTFASAIWGGSLFYLGTTAQVFLMALLLQIGFGFSAFHAGLTLLASAIGSTLTRFFLRPILRTFGFRSALMGNALLTGACLTGCGLLSTQTPLPAILALLFVAGFSRASQFITIQSLAYVDVPPAQVSRATSFTSMMQQLMQSIGVGLSALVVHLSTVAHGHEHVTVSDVSLGFFAIGLLSALSAILFHRLPAGAGKDVTGR